MPSPFVPRFRMFTAAAPLLALVMAASAPLRAAATPLTHTEIAADLAVFEAALKQLHPVFAVPAAREALDRFMDDVRRAAAHVTDVEGLYRLLAPVAAVVRDGHTSLAPAEATTSAWPLLPLDVAVDASDRSLWVDGPAASPIPPGSRIVAINGIPAQGLLDRLMPVVARDGTSEGRVGWALGRPYRFSRALAAMYGAPTVYQVRFIAPGSTARQEIQLEGVPAAALPAPPATAQSVSLGFEDNGDIAVLTVPTLAASAAGEIDQAFATLAARPPRALVIDVRDNPGGRDELGKVLFARLAQQPFEYYRSLRVTATPTHEAFAMIAAKLKELPVDDDGTRRVPSPNLGVQPPIAPGFAGPVIVLINAGTFSSAAEFASVAQAASRATLVGEETGGGRCGNHSGVIFPVTLPHSRLRLDVPLVEYTMAVPCAGDTGGVTPDETVVPTLADRLAGRDPQKARAVALAHRQARRP